MADPVDERAQSQRTEKAWSEAVARTWLGDDAFRELLLSDPRRVLTTMGAAFPPDAKIRIVEDQEGEFTFVLPRKPAHLGSLSAGDVIELYGTCPCTVCSTMSTAQAKPAPDGH